jgi:type I restriction enzyme S subunit
MKSTWPTKKLGEICEKIKAGGTPSRKISRYWGGDIPFVKIEDLTSAKFYLENTQEKITEEGLENSNAWILPPNSVLFSIYASIGEVAINKVPVATNQAILGLIPKSEIVDPKFLAYSLKKFGKYLISYNIQSTQKNLTLEIVKNAEIPLPPLHIQQKIVKILDTIQSAVEIQEKIIEKTKELKKSMMAELFKYGAPSFRKGRKLKKTEIGEIPEDWEVVRLGEVCEILSGGNAPQELKYFENGKYPFVRVQHLDGEKPYIEKWDLVNEEAIKEYNLKLFPAETIIFPKSGASINLEKRAKLKIPSFIVNHLCALIVNQNKIIVDFVFYYLITKKLSESSGGSTLPYLNLSKIKNLKIPLPPLPEQQEIAEILQTIDQKIEIEKKKKELYEELFKTMLNKIMSQEIDVEKIEI